MDAGSSRRFTSLERLSQLQAAEALFNEGLYTSALLITSIHLCTIGPGEQWFEGKAFERYARCLTRLKQNKRSLIYYKKYSYLKGSPRPSDFKAAMERSMKGKAVLKTEGVEEALSSPPKAQGPSAVETILAERGLDRETRAKQKLERDELLGRAMQSATKMALQKRNAAIALAAKKSLRSSPVKAGLTGVASPSIPPVVPQSETIRRHLASRAENTENVADEVEDRKSGSKAKARSAEEIMASLQKQQQDGSDMDFAQSCFEVDDLDEASETLANIPESRKTVKMYLFLVHLARRKVDVLSEKACWESIAEMQPLAIEAYVQLLRAQVPLAIVLNMIPSNCSEKPWMRTYLQGIDRFLKMNYHEALADFAALNESYPNNVDINLRIALCLKWMGKTAKSCFVFSWARRLDAHILDDMYHYGVCLKRQSKILALNKLASDLLRSNDQHPDAWCVQALYWDAIGDREKAIRSALRASQLNPDHCGALQLRGQLSMGSNPLEAMNLFREAYRIDKDLVTYEGLVNTFILLKRHLEALELAREAKRLMPESAHALAIYGMAVYHLGDTGTKEALSALQEALRMDPGCVEAASHLVSIYAAKGQTQDAIEILDQQIDYQPVDGVHIKKAEIYTATEQWEKALSSYRSALSANPYNALAKVEMARVEKILSGCDEDEDDEVESDNPDEQDNEAMDADPDQHEHLSGNMDDGSVHNGETEYVDEFEPTSPHDPFIQRSRMSANGSAETPYGSAADGHFELTPPPAPQQQHPPPTPQLPPRHVAQGSLVGSIRNSSTLSSRLQMSARPSTTRISQRERELDEFEDGEEMDE
ncbi:MAG: hypothetical protein J3Q66DRAFT_347649 [Benniella sp.]|nr:MAG: hypothetical protein J3Q66DRAFT_347649 [Benniella sp.]